MHRRALLKGLLAGAAAIAMARPGSGGAVSLDTVVKRGRMTIAVYRDFAPWSWRKDGVLTGIDVDLGRAIGEGLGVAVDFMELTADENVEDDLRNAVWKGSVVGQPPADLMMHVPFDPAFSQRITEAVIFGPYHRERFVMACDPAQADCAGGIGGLEGNSIGVEIDSVPDFYLSGSFNGRFRSKLVHFKTPDLAVAAMRNGELPAVMASLAQIEHGLGEARSRYEVGTMPLPGLFRPTWEVGMAVKEDGRDLAYKVADIVAELDRNGKLAAIFAAHGITYSSTVPA